MRIAFAIRDRKNFIGGPAADAVRLLMALRARGHDIHVLGFWVGKEKSHSHLDKLAASGIPCRIIRRQKYAEEGVKWILEQLIDIQPDIFVSGLSTEGCFASYWLKTAGIPVVNVCYGNDKVNLGRSVYFSDCEHAWNASGHVVYGESLLAILRSATQNTPPAIAVFGVVPTLNTTAQISETENFSIVYAGRLTEVQKRIGDMLQAFIRLCNVNRHFQFHILGDSVDNERVTYEQMVQNSGYADRITFHGILSGDAYYNELAKHQVIILLSDTEGIPGTILDGMAMGLVPVCLNYPGVNDLITHDEDGLVVEDREESLALALSILASNPLTWKRMSENAKARIVKHRSQSVVVDRWEKFLELLVSDASKRCKLSIPDRIKLPRRSRLLLEDKRMPGLWGKVTRRMPRFLVISMLCAVAAGCGKSAGVHDLTADKESALNSMKQQFLEGPFDEYHLKSVPDVRECVSLLNDQGIFTDSRGLEQNFLANLDSFYTIENASFDYSRFLLQSFIRIWKIAEEYRGKSQYQTDDKTLMKLLRGIAHYGKLELDRPGNRFQHNYSDFKISTVAINMYFCLFSMMEDIRIAPERSDSLRLQAYEYLTLIGMESWTVPHKYDSTDLNPISAARFQGYTWWITGNALEYKPIYPCALMLHSVEMMDVISELVSHAVTVVSHATVDTAFWREGITPDGGAWSYGRQNRAWSYAFRGLYAAVQRMADFQGTPWGIPMTEEKVLILMDFIRLSSFFHYKGFTPPCLDRQNFNVRGQVPVDVPSRRMAQFLRKQFPWALTHHQKMEIAKFVKYATVQGQTDHVEFDKAYSGTQYFYCNDDLIRKTRDYYVIVNMASKRVDGIESAVQYSDAYNFFSTDGGTFFMRKGDEYHQAMGAFEITAHPGVTARYGDAKLVPGRNLMGHCSKYNFACGVTNGNTACAGFIFEKMRGIDKYKSWNLPDTLNENLQLWLYGVTAHKSYFWFDDQLVALGCGISSDSPELDGEIHTTIDQSLVRGTTYKGRSLSFPDSSHSLLMKLRDQDELHSVLVENNGFIFQILPEQTPGEVWAKLERRPTRWDALNMLNAEVVEKSRSADIFQLWINHGIAPKDDRYGYVVYCGRGEMPSLPLVLENSATIQAVMSADSNTIQAIFYATDTLRCASRVFHVTAPCAFNASISAGQLSIDVSDAQMDMTLDSITVTTNIPLSQSVRLDNALYQVSIALPTGIYRGKQGRAVYKISPLH